MLLAITIFGLKLAGRELLIVGAVVVIIVAAIGWFAYTKRAN
jgi:hypothetical protein